MIFEFWPFPCREIIKLVKEVMFRYHFLGHLSAELNEICCGSLLNSVLKMVQTSRTVRIPAFFLFGKDGYVYVQLCWATFTVGSYNSDSYVLIHIIGFTDPNPCLIDYFVLCNCESYVVFFMDILLKTG